MKIYKTWEELENEILKCTKCRLHESKTNYVIGAGNRSADVLFVGEAPGRKEDEAGKPFVGRSGEILNELLGSVELRRDDIYITNTVKCRPPLNRDPKQEEKEICQDYLLSQILLIKPKVIATLGRHSMEYFFTLFDIEKKSISAVHGKAFRVDSLYFRGHLVPLFHPAVALYNVNRKEELINDFSVLKDFL